MDASGGKVRILVVDDDDLVLSLIENILSKDGFDVETTNDSSGALNLIERTHPDVVISDLMMPNVDGFDLCKGVRDNKDLDDIKFIVVTAKAYASDEARAFECGANGYLKKPINPQTFPDRLRRIVEDKIDLTFWGVRGTLPKTGEGALRYGGNTSCVTLEFPSQQLFIFDGGVRHQRIRRTSFASGS